MLEDVAASIARYFPRQFAEFVTGYLAGFGVGAIGIQARNLLLAATLRAFLPFTEAENDALARLATTLLAASNFVNSQLVSQPFFKLGWTAAGGANLARLAMDPPLLDLLISPPPPAIGGLGGPGLDLAIEPESLLTCSVAGAAVPTLFRLGIRNGGATEDVFILSFDALPPGFTAQTSVESVPVAPGETAQVGVCLRPSGALGAPGSNAAFTVRVTPQSNPGGAVPETEPFLLPAIHGVVLEASPSELSTTWHTGRHHDHPDVRRQRARVGQPRTRAAARPRRERRSGERPAGEGASFIIAPSFTPAGGTPLTPRSPPSSPHRSAGSSR